jgi:hypothetical protein
MTMRPTTNPTPKIARAVERVRNGATASAAALAEGCDDTAVARACRGAGVPVLPRGRPRKPGVDAAAICVLGSGEKVAEAARREGVSARTVYNRVLEMRRRAREMSHA